MTSRPRGPEDSRRPGTGIGVFFAIGLVVSLLLLLPLAMSSDDCGQDDLRFKCSAGGQALLPALPWLALILGLILAGIGWSQQRRWTNAPTGGLAAAVGLYLVAAAVALVYSAQTPIPPDPHQIAAEYAQLATRPDLTQMTARYQQVITSVEQQLDTVVPGATFAPVSPDGGGSCDGEFAAIGAQDNDSADARTTELMTDTPAIFDDTNWARTLTAIDTAVRAAGFTTGPRSIGEHVVQYTDGYGATLEFDGDHTGTNALLDLTTGCHLTATAKQQGHP